MCERLKQTVLKTVIPERVSGVRIPLPPPFSLQIVQVFSFPSQSGTAFNRYEVHDDDERKSNSNCGKTTVRSERAGTGSRDDRRNVCVGLLRESGEGTLHDSGLHQPDQLLPEGEPCSGSMEGSHGSGGKSRGDGGSHAGLD